MRLVNGAMPSPTNPRWSPQHNLPRSARRTTTNLTDAEKRVLAAATELYASTLLADEDALAYLVGRGFPRRVVEHYRLGYSSGTDLARYLQWRRLPVRVAMRLGLVRKDGREFLAGRITVPEFRAGWPAWLTGRILESASDNSTHPERKYLDLPGPKPLLGWNEASLDRRGVCLTEGPLDLLTLRMWGVPAVALAGSAPSPDKLTALRSFDRVYLALDQDKGGREATERLVQQLGDRAVRIDLPAGVKDVADLAKDPAGEDRFAQAILRAARSRQPVTQAA